MSSAAAPTTVARHMLGITKPFQDLLGLFVESIFVSRESAPLACSVLLR